MRQLLGNRAFRRLWAAGLLSTLGTQVSRIGLVLFLFQKTDSVPGLALLIVLETLPGALAAPVAGAIIDRLDRRALMIGADLARALCLLAVLANPTVETIYLMAALGSIASAFFQPAERALLPQLVTAGELPRANGLVESTGNLVLIVGPLAGAELFLRVGIGPTLVVDAVSFVVSAVLVLGVGAAARRVAGATARRALDTERASPLTDLREGWSYLVHHRLVLHLVLLFFVSLLCVGLWLPLAPFFIREFLGGSQRLLGVQTAAFGAGGVLGGLAAPRLVARLGKGTALSLAFLAEGLAMTLYALVPDARASVAIIFVWGVVVSVVVVPFYSILQTVVDERFRGRVFSVLKQSENLALLAAMGLAVALQRVLASHWIFCAAGLAYCGVAALASMSAGGRALRATR